MPSGITANEMRRGDESMRVSANLLCDMKGLEGTESHAGSRVSGGVGSNRSRSSDRSSNGLASRSNGGGGLKDHSARL